MKDSKALMKMQCSGVELLWPARSSWSKCSTIPHVQPPKVPLFLSGCGDHSYPVGFIVGKVHDSQDLHQVQPSISLNPNHLPKILDEPSGRFLMNVSAGLSLGRYIFGIYCTPLNLLSNPVVLETNVFGTRRDRNPLILTRAPVLSVYDTAAP